MKLNFFFPPRTLGAIFATIFVFVLWGCTGTQSAEPITHYYTLSYDPPVLDTQPSVPITIRVDAFQTEPAYNTTRMVFAEAPHKIQFYNYHRWYVEPGSLVTSFLTRDLKSSRRFKGVFGPQHPYDVNYSVTGSVDAFYEWDGPRQWNAMLKLTVTLLKADIPDPSEQVLFQKRYKAQIPTTEKSPQAIAVAMGTAMQKLSRDLIHDIYEALSQRLE